MPATRGPLPRPLVAALVLLHALPLMLFGAALLPESYFASRSYFTSSMLLLVTLSISVAWLLYAMTLAPMASNVKARAPPLRGGISQDLEVEFQAWKGSTFAQLQMVVVLVWAAYITAWAMGYANAPPFAWFTC